MDIESFITKKSDLDKNDSLSEFMRHSAQQHHYVYRVFYDFIKEIKPARILEIGTASGGFTQFLKIICNELELETNIRSYDISPKSWYYDIINEGIDIRVENIFSDNYQEVDGEVIEYIKQDGLTIVLCDGGNKIEEFKLLSKYIKVNDFIMAHDYIDTIENFQKNYNFKIWNWQEITEEAIESACNENNLIPYNKNKFDNVVWVCKLKVL